MTGHVHKVGNDINTDLIIAGKNKRDSYDPKTICTHLLEDYDPEFYSRIKPGDIIVAGKNFGCGSSREHAAHVIKMAGISAVLAKSFARIFFRNSINIGLPLIECDTEKINNNDRLSIDLIKGIIINETTGERISFSRLPPAIAGIFDEGGLINYLIKNGDFE